MKDKTRIPSDKEIFLWNIVGNATNSLFSVVILIFVTRTLAVEEADIFSVAWNISMLMTIIGMFQIRTYQATDVEEKFQFKQYLILRIITVTCMIVVSVIYTISRDYSFYKSIIVLIVCFFKVFDCMSDVYEGWFQQRDRLDLAGKALTFRTIVAIICFGVAIFLTKDLLISCIVLLASYIVCFVLFDIRYKFHIKHKEKDNWKNDKTWLVRLTLAGLPLFINGLFIMSITNTPKMVIDSAIEQGIIQQGTQTVFNILFLPASVLSLVYIFFRPLLTRMAIMWNNNKVHDFVKILVQITACLVGVAVVVLLGCATIGIPVLSLVYGIDLTAYKIHLIIILLGGIFCAFSYVFDNAMVVMRCQNLLICAYAGAWIYIKLVADWLVSKWGLMGVSLSYATSMLVFFLLTAFLYLGSYYKIKKEKEKQ